MRQHRSWVDATGTPGTVPWVVVLTLHHRHRDLAVDVDASVADAIVRTWERVRAGEPAGAPGAAPVGVRDELLLDERALRDVFAISIRVGGA